LLSSLAHADASVPDAWAPSCVARLEAVRGATAISVEGQRVSGKLRGASFSVGPCPPGDCRDARVWRGSVEHSELAMAANSRTRSAEIIVPPTGKLGESDLPALQRALDECMADWADRCVERVTAARNKMAEREPVMSRLEVRVRELAKLGREVRGELIGDESRLGFMVQPCAPLYCKEDQAWTEHPPSHGAWEMTANNSRRLAAMSVFGPVRWVELARTVLREALDDCLRSK
jgi:hypothetical protein